MRRSYLDLFKAARLAVQECKVRPDETVVVLTDTAKNPAVGEAFYSASVASGAETIFISMLTRPDILMDPPAAVVSALMEADIVFDAVTMAWPYAPAMSRIMAARTRVLQILVPEAGLIARPPDPTVTERGRKAKALLEGHTSLRITSDLGTDITFDWSGRPVHIEDGVADEPGEWDSMGTGFLAIAPLETRGDGVVFVQGTVFLPMDQHYVTEQPIRMDIESGRIVNIERDHELARSVADWFGSWDDPNSYVVAHTGFGFDDRAKMLPPDPGAWESIHGGVHIGFGSNTGIIFQGENAAKSHADFVLLNADLQVDGLKVIESGRFTPESGLAKA